MNSNRPPVRANPASKTWATWIAILGGALGLHHFYLHGPRYWVGWLYPIPTCAGLVGVVRMRNLGQDDTLSWLLAPWLGFSVSVAMLCAILIALTPDAKWARQHASDPARPLPPRPSEDDDETPPPAGLVETGWGPVLGAIIALMLGAVALLGSIAFSIQKIFEWSV